MPRRGGLGSGIGALFGEDIAQEEAEQLQISIEKIEPRADQPRQIHVKRMVGNAGEVGVFAAADGFIFHKGAVPAV